jgi:hypothetical protein
MNVRMNSQCSYRSGFLTPPCRLKEYQMSGLFTMIVRVFASDLDTLSVSDIHMAAD